MPALPEQVQETSFFAAGEGGPFEQLNMEFFSSPLSNRGMGVIRNAPRLTGVMTCSFPMTARLHFRNQIPDEYFAKND
jgi:hypothetical protein